MLRTERHSAPTGLRAFRMLCFDLPQLLFLSNLECMQAPTSTKGRMFKVLKEVVEENSQGNRTDKLVPCFDLTYFIPEHIASKSVFPATVVRSRRTRCFGEGNGGG